MVERVVSFMMGSLSLSLRGAYDLYLEPIAGKNFVRDPLARLAGALPPEPTILDVGANVGFTTLILAAVCPKARIVAFEPVPANIRLLEENLRANGVTNVTVVRAAVGEAKGTVTMAGEGPWSVIAGSGSDVPVVTLDAWCAEHLPDMPIDLVKIDVEGYEPNVLAGALELMRRWRPRTFLEFNSWTFLLQGCNPIAFARYLIDAFEIEPVSGVDMREPTALVHENMVRQGCVFDLAMRPRSEASPVWPSELKFGNLEQRPSNLALAALNQRLTAEIRALRNSTSWRVTAPLRALKDSLSGRG